MSWGMTNIPDADWNREVNHPVGSWWISNDPTSPAAKFGGTWERLEGKFLLAADSSHPAGSAGGAFSVTQTVEQMPSHGHKPSQYVKDTWVVNGPSQRNKVARGTEIYALSATTIDGWSLGKTASTGGGQPMDITNPNYATYMWLRTA